MSTTLKGSAQRVQDYLAQFDIAFVVKQLPYSTRTAFDASQALGCDIAQIAKSLIFKNRDSGEPVLVVTSGKHAVCKDKVFTATGIELDKADAKFVKEKIGYAIGGVPPVALNKQVITILDNELKNYDVIWAAAGTPNAVFELKACNFNLLTQGVWIELAK
ncbi:YbaK/EbsC family protein [Pseudoalteromonas sp. MMG012]|uniref:YbaK/EbsC family protein n=1 Tax=Pseudoalteromonas sp. MMG012 TaxID=2822686 RepID=UPI001B3A21C3|nr:YbaK/EbsC family protein [Pseudoalteromonas sp. MMG012]MBQ4850347.1 YbaK/EbsC family protein [Pseudoalteromonas sp. MMG012]